MAGADVVQMVSVLLKRGPEWLGSVLESGALDGRTRVCLPRQLRGSLSLAHCPDPSAFERANYMRILQGWRIVAAGKFLSSIAAVPR